ncbi:MAG: hypothetical protein DELT_01344 [Desulfovibrio sp.]
MRIFCRAFALALCLTMALAFGANARTDKLSPETLVQLRTAYPEIAAALDARDDTLKRFRALFSGPAKSWRENFLSKTALQSTVDYQYMAQEGRYGKDQREKFLKHNATVLRYLTLATKTPADDPAFLILLRPVCASSSYSGAPQPLANVLAEYDQYKKSGTLDPDKYLTRRVQGEYWGAILTPGTKVSYSSSEDRFLAHIVRAKEGGFTLTPIIAPVREDYFPGVESPFRPQKAEKAPHNMYINECELAPRLTPANENGPFVFAVDVTQLFDDTLRYTCAPKCTGFTYTWNDVTNSFHMSEGVCREDDAWQVQSPFDGETLLPVANYKQELARKNELVAAHEKTVRDAAAAYIASFEGPAATVAETDIRNWFFDRQMPVYHLIGQEEAFIAKMQEMDAPALAFLQKVSALITKPDARLVLLLDEQSTRQSAPKERRGYPDRREPSPSSLLQAGKKDSRDKKIPWFAAYGQRQLKLLAAPVKDSRGRMPYTAKGLEGGDVIKFAYPKRYSNQEFDHNRFSIKKGSDGAYWGLAALARERYAYSRQDGYTETLYVERHRIMRVANGKVSFVTPELPKEAEYFTKPQMRGRDSVQWFDKSGRSARCYTAPGFRVDTTKTPFTLSATTIQYDTFERIECTPECVVPYTWNGKAYVKGAPVCQPEGTWGAVEKEMRRR